MCHNKTVNEMETYWLSNEEKFPVQRPVEKVILMIIWDTKGPLTIDFLEKKVLIKSAFYYEPLRQYSPYLLNDPQRNYQEEQRNQMLFN